MRILVVGPGRSGTSWVASTLGSTPGAGYLLEPDNPNNFPFALRASGGTETPLLLRPTNRDHPTCDDCGTSRSARRSATCRGQQRIAVWLHSKSNRDERSRMTRAEDPKASMRLRVAAALAVPRSLPAGTRHRIVKSIQSQFMVEWIVANWEPEVVVCRRHPLDIVASRMELWNQRRDVAESVRDEAKRRYDVDIPQIDDQLAASAWGVAVQMSVLDDVLHANPTFHAVDHEDVCRDPVDRFRSLATALGLEWTAQDEAAVEESNRPGTGYERNRIAADLPGAWRRRLSVDDARIASHVIAQFPVSQAYDLSV